MLWDLVRPRNLQRSRTSHLRVRALRIFDAMRVAFPYYYLTSLTVFIAAFFAVEFVPLCQKHPGSVRRVDLPSGLAAWDGEWYAKIAAVGYSYDPQQMSSVAFFPAYPMLAYVIVQSTGMRPEVACLAVSNLAYLSAFVLFYLYARKRRASVEPTGVQELSLLALGLVPSTFYFRMAYSESLFLLLLLVVMYGLERKWNLLTIATLCGLATATRSVGVALVPVVALYIWRQSDKLRAVKQFILIMPICVWGLAAYMLFQAVYFGTPFAFSQTQVHWVERPQSFAEKVVGLLTLEPIRGVYDSRSPCYWSHVPPHDNVLFNLKAANPIYFLGTIGLILLGWRKKWLTSYEILLSAGLLAIPYWLQASRSCMNSQARYAAIVFPAYLVIGNLLARLPQPLVPAVLAVSGIFLAIYTMLFVSWYWYY